METFDFSSERRPAYLVGDENDMILLSQEEYISKWNGSVPKHVYKGHFYSTYDLGLNNGLFFEETASMIAEIRNGQVCKTRMNGTFPFASEG
ncbi:hypothetical protein [Ectobacillus polymachus]|uniref:hypothetical protein n=1 Tax=Ectobacillus polymachus TaxID=1508806 RepID=UPI003A84EC85